MDLWIPLTMAAGAVFAQFGHLRTYRSQRAAIASYRHAAEEWERVAKRWESIANEFQSVAHDLERQRDTAMESAFTLGQHDPPQ